MVDFNFYESVYHGSAIPLEEWTAYEARAAAQLARYKRIYTVSAPDDRAESMAVCAMAEALHSFDLLANGEGGTLQSASLGSVSVSYSGGSGIDISPRAQAKELYRCAGLYLDIYRGAGGW